MPRLVADRRGRYRVRLEARHVLRRPAARRRAQAAAGPAAVDEVTVEATPAVGPVGLPVQTITRDGGIALGGQVYRTSAPWVQLLVLDRETLDVVSNQGFGSSTQLSEGDLFELGAALNHTSTKHLVILSGGARAVQAPDLDDPASQFSLNLAGTLEQAGGEAGGLWDWPGTFQRSFESGHWSLIGVPNAEGSAHQNMFGMIYGQTAGAGSQPGALTGYLQEGEQEGMDPSDDFEAYGFASGNYTTIDTQLPGSPPGVNTIQIGDQNYSSDPIPSGGGGFHVLVLDSLLERTAERTFVTNAGADPNSDQQTVVQMQEFISDTTAPGLGAPGYLVVVQSIGQPFGYFPNWVYDQPLVENSYNPNQRIPRDDTTWFGPIEGVTLAGALGDLGGQVAHDQIAQMVDAGQFPEVKPAYDPGGYTLIASTGALRDAAPIYPSAAPLSRSQAGSKSSRARVVGTLERDQQGLWTVSNPATTDDFESASVAMLAYQPPTPWPLSTTPAQVAANGYIAGRLFTCPNSDPDCNPPTDVRDAYYENFDSDWDSRHDKLRDSIGYPSGGSSQFDQATFAAVKQQLLTEMNMVADVYKVVENWQGVFTNSELSAYIELQTIAAAIVQALNEQDSTASSTSNTLAIVGDSLWVAQSLVDLTGQEEVAIGVGALAGALDVASDVSSNSGGGPDTAPVVTEATQLGQEIAARYEDLASSVGTTGEILVSDWGKLQQADDASGTDWKFNQDVIDQTRQALTISAKRELWPALLSTEYGSYVVNPANIDSSWTKPSQIRCADGNHPFSDADANANSWVTRVVGNTPAGAPILRWAGLTLPLREDSFSNAGSVPGDPTKANDPTAKTPQWPDITGALFGPIGLGDTDDLSIDPIALFADARFEQKWFYCDGYCFNCPGASARGTRPPTDGVTAGDTQAGAARAERRRAAAGPASP